MSGCYVYIIGVGDDHRPCKIGITNDPSSRLRQLQTGNPMRLHIVETYWAHSRDQAAYWELCAHKYFENNRMAGEWFNVPASLVVARVRQWKEDGEPKQPPQRREFTARSSKINDFDPAHPVVPEYLLNKPVSGMTEEERLEFWACFDLPKPPAGFDDWYLVGSPNSGLLAAFPVVGFINGERDD